MNPVLIVGAGPVGLVLACDLLRQGVPVRVVDRSEHPSTAPRSRAVLIWPRTLELLRGIGLAVPLVAAGHRLTGIGYQSRGRLLGRVRLDQLSDTPYPFVITLPQYETERLLLDRLSELGGVVERGVTLQSLRAGHGTQHAVLQHADGTLEELTVPWLVGADGAHSRVRRELGIGFEGDTVDVTFGIADVPIAGPVPRDTLHYCYSADGALGVVPLPDGLFRVAISIPHRDETDPPPAREVFQHALEQRAAGFGTLGEPRWTGSFRVRCRVAESFRRGGCFLAGDAAHIISPAGGQGMNYGIQDAVNLAWKLGGVIRGTLAEPILDSYEQERSAAVHKVARTTATQTRLGMIQRGPRLAGRDLAVRLAAGTGLLQRVVAPLMAQTGIGYGTSQHGVGARLPFFAAGPDLPETIALAQDSFTILLLPGGRKPIHIASAFQHLGGRAAVRERAGTAVWGRFPGRKGAILTVRPDGHVAYTAEYSLAGLTATSAFLDSVTTVPALI